MPTEGIGRSADDLARSSFTMQMGKLLILVIALSALAGCAKYYHMPLILNRTRRSRLLRGKDGMNVLRRSN